ncbi:hypothetical protein AB0K51_26785 [Kitasatospora sp. NPDC049285]|uniref:hypothetical protein n=1 Tax=Kitasatospora sp. NPDC049285 TaxID=3157096 RepID=UPI003432CFD4
MTTDDERLPRALRDLADRHPGGGPAPVAELLSRGRRARRLRTLTATATASCAVAVLAATTLVLAPSGPAAAPVAPSTGSASASASSGSPTPSPSPTPTALTAAQLLEMLRAKLPPSLRLSEPWTHGPGPNGLGASTGPTAISVAAAFTVTDGAHTGTAEIEISHVAPGNRPDTCDIAFCTVTPQPGGGSLTVYLPDYPGVPQVWRATLRRPDGTLITASAGNVPGAVSASMELYPNPPLLDGPQLTALALDPAWLAAATGLPAL